MTDEETFEDVTEPLPAAPEEDDVDAEELAGEDVDTDWLDEDEEEDAS